MRVRGNDVFAHKLAARQAPANLRQERVSTVVGAHGEEVGPGLRLDRRKVLVRALHFFTVRWVVVACMAVAVPRQ